MYETLDREGDPVSAISQSPRWDPPTPPKKVCKLLKASILDFLKISKPILLKIKFRNFFMRENFFDFHLESRFFLFCTKNEPN